MLSVPTQQAKPDPSASPRLAALAFPRWDVKGPDLENFYTQLDSDGDGLEVRCGAGSKPLSIVLSFL